MVDNDGFIPDFHNRVWSRVEHRGQSATASVGFVKLFCRSLIVGGLALLENSAPFPCQQSRFAFFDKMKEGGDGMVKAPTFQMVDLEPPKHWSKIREKLLTWDSEQVLPSHWDCIVAYAKEYEETPNKLQWDQFVVFFFESPSTTLRLDHRWDELKQFMIKDADVCLDWVQFD